MPSNGTDNAPSSGKKADLERWEILQKREIFAAEPWLKLSVHQVRLPNGQVIDDYYQIELTEYVVIFAQTETGDAIALRSYKHGVRDVCMVLPAGAMEAGEQPVDSAKRELLEETGYSADVWNPLGSFVVHGNYGCGKAHIFAAKQARKTAEPDSGDLETMEVVLMQPSDILQAVRKGEVAGLGTVAAIGLALNPEYSGTDRISTNRRD